MPIRADYRKFYGREWRTKWRPYLIERSGNCCEHCGAPNGGSVLTLPYGLWYDVRGKEWRAPAGQLPHDLFMSITTARAKWKLIQCGGAHLNHEPSEHREDNLAWLCRRCHLAFDEAHHADTRKQRKDAARPILVMLAS